MLRDPTRTRPHPRGFTLIEITVVLIVLGLCLGLLALRGPGESARLTLRAIGGEIAGGLREARGRAIAQNRPVRLEIDLSHHQWQIDAGKPHEVPMEVGIRILTVRGEVPDAGLSAIRFEPDGSSTGGRIELSKGERRLAIGVDWINGRVRLGDDG